MTATTLTDAATEVRPSWQDVVLSFAPPARRTDRARELLRKLPLTLIMLGQALLTWRLSNVAFNDEALYIDAGHDLIHQALHGGSLQQDYGTFFSGAPALYPVLAGGLDTVGGLPLVRLFSLLCTLVATFCVYRVTLHFFSRRPALFAALAFALSGSVLFVGKYATYDAPCLTLIALAVLATATRRSILSGSLVGTLLALAVATKYAGLAFVPFVLILGVLVRSAYPVRDVTRMILAGVTTAALLGGGYYLWGASIAEGVSFTTTGRSALQPKPYSVLFVSAGLDSGLLVSLAVLGVVLLAVQRFWRRFLLSGVFLGAGIVLPASQMRIHEFVSLDKHTAFAALFLAVPAGLALDWVFTQRVLIKIVMCGLVWLLLIDGLVRSNVQYQGWPTTIKQPIAYVVQHPVAGSYLSLDGSSAAYYTKQVPQVRWVTSFYVFSLGPAALVAAIKSHRYVGFLYRSDEAEASQIKDEATALGSDPYYRLVATYRVDPYTKSRWYLWQHTPTPTAAKAVTAAPGSTRATTPAATPTGVPTALSVVAPLLGTGGRPRY